MERDRVTRRWIAGLLPRGIRHRLYLLVGLMLLPLLMLLGWIYYQRYETRRMFAQQAELEVAQGVSTTFAAFVDGIRRECISLGHAILLCQNDDAANITRLLKSAADHSPAIRNLSWVSPSGEVRASSVPGGVGHNLSGRPYFRQILKGRDWSIGDITSSGAFVSSPTIAIAVAARDESGLRGMVVAALEPTRVGELALTQQRPEGSAFAIFDSRGVLVYHSRRDRPEWSERIAWLDSDILLRRLLLTGHSQTGVVDLPVVGGKWVVARAPIASIGWAAGAGRREQVAFGPIRQDMFRDLVAFVPISLFSFLLAYLLGTTIAEPLRRLERNTHDNGGLGFSEDGDPDAPAEVRSLRLSLVRLTGDLARETEALRRSEQCASKSRDLLRAIMEGAGSQVVSIDRNYRLLGFNRAFRELISGLCKAEVQVGDRLEELLDRLPLEKSQMLECWNRALNGDQYVVEYRFGGSGWPESWFELRFSPILDEKNSVIGATQISMDISLRKQTEAALQESEERFRTVLTSLSEGLVIHSHDGSVIYQNPAALQLHGLNDAPQYILEKDIPGLCEVRDENEIPIPYDQWLHLRVLRGERFDNVILHVIRTDGSRDFYGSYSGIPIFDITGGVRLAFLTVRDETARVMAERELQRAKDELEERVAERTAELVRALDDLREETERRVAAVDELRDKERLLIQQSRLAAMGEMIANISHQWRQPLNILGLVVQEMGIVAAQGALSAEAVREGVEKAMRLIADMSRTIDDFRNFFSIDKDRTAFSIREVVEKMLFLMQGDFRQLQVQVDLVEEWHRPVEGLRNEFSQVILNLLTNARDAFRERKPPHPRVTVTILCEQGMPVVRISDNGGGIPEGIIDRIFEPYFTTKGPDKGTGIGLFMSKTIIEKHMGGKLTCRNAGEGAEFTVELKAAACEPEEP